MRTLCKECTQGREKERPKEAEKQNERMMRNFGR